MPPKRLPAGLKERDVRGYEGLYRVGFDSDHQPYVKNTRTNKRLTESLRMSKFVRLEDDRGVRRDVALHLVVANTFMEGFDPSDRNFVVDHMNSDQLDNSWANIRVLTRSENTHNQSRAKGYSEVRPGKFKAQIQDPVANRIKYLGTYNSEEEARAAYLAASELYYPGIKLNHDIVATKARIVKSIKRELSIMERPEPKTGKRK